MSRAASAEALEIIPFRFAFSSSAASFPWYCPSPADEISKRKCYSPACTRLEKDAWSVSTAWLFHQIDGLVALYDENASLEKYAVDKT